MQINVRYLDNLKVEAKFDDFTLVADQPIRYKGHGSAPGPFDYFLASSVLCAAYFVKVYCASRGISTDEIKLTQDNIVDPENRYLQTFNISIDLPEHLSDHDREGILKAMDRCTVKKVIQQSPIFNISQTIKSEFQNVNILKDILEGSTETRIYGKDSSLEDSLKKMISIIDKIGIKLEIMSWRNPVPHVWSVHVRDADAPMCFSNGKGATKMSALCSALGEFLERVSTNYFYSDFYFGEELIKQRFVHYPQEKWFKISSDNQIPKDLMDEHLVKVFGQDGELKLSHLLDTNSGLKERGVCALPFIRQSDLKEVFIPVNLLANIFASNGMSAGNSIEEARVQALCEIVERAIKNQIISQELSLPNVPQEVLNRFPQILNGIEKLKELGYPVLIKDASLGGRFPLMCVTLINPHNGGVFASFGAHLSFEVALERALTELLQGRSFEGLNDVLPPTFNEQMVQDQNNLIDHFIDSTGVVSWKFFNNKPDYEFSDWDFKGSTKEEFNHLMNLFKSLEKEVYIADYEDMGIKATRIIIPEFSEIYLPEDLIWDNHNRSLDFREDVINLHLLSEDALGALAVRFEESGLDHQTSISELIGIAFDENSAWEKLTIGELLGLIHIRLKNYGEAKIYFEEISLFSLNTHERKKIHQGFVAVLEILSRDDLELNDYLENFKLAFGDLIVSKIESTINGSDPFCGLVALDKNLSTTARHQKLLNHLRKIQAHRESLLNI
jgi:ribosomal protein S12 methylthiotransferase accessory factor